MAARSDATDRLLQIASCREGSATLGARSGALEARPRLGVAILTCMDARIDVFATFRLSPGDAHVLRNAGGVATDDVVRSLAVSQRMLGTRQVMVVHHLDCGLRDLDEVAFAAELRRESGEQPVWDVGSLGSPDDSVRETVKVVAGSPFLVGDQVVRGFLYDERTGGVEEVR